MNSLLPDTLSHSCSITTLARRAAFVAMCWFAAAHQAAGPVFAGETPAGELRPASATVSAEENSAPLIELDGSISVSPDGGELAYSWKQLSGPEVALSNPDAAKPRFRASAPGVYEFQLIVSSNGLDSEPYIVRLEIERENLPPVGKVPPEAWGQVGRRMEVDGGASFDPEGKPLTYQWRVVTPGLHIPREALRKPVLVVEPNADGMFEIELIVSDGEKTSAPVRCMLGVKPRPLPPVAQARIIPVSMPPGATATPVTDLAAMAPPKAEEKTELPPLPRFAALPPIMPAPETAVPAVSAPSALPAELSPANDRVPVPAPAAPSPPRPIPAAGPEPAPALSPEPGPPLSLSLPPELLSIPPISVPTSMERFSDAAAAGADDADAPASPVAIVVAPARALTGSLVKMDAAQSYDPHGGQLVYRWRQTGGPRVTKYSADERLGDAAPAFRPEEPGLYSFSLSVFNGTAGSEPIAIDVDVIAAPLVAPPSPVNVPPRPESDLRRVPELTPLPNSAPPPTIFPKVRIEDMKGRPAARILRGERRK